MKYVFAFIAVSFLAVVFATVASAHLVAKPANDSLDARIASQKENLAHVKYVARHGKGEVRKWHRKWVPILERELDESLAKKQPNWAALQIWLAEKIGPLHDDAWPNCPDPFDSPRYTWVNTVNCENEGNWLDSPGFYRCGLQFDPAWEVKYRIRVCP